MRRNQLTRSERSIEDALLRGEFRPVSQSEFKRVAEAIKRRKKDKVLNIRINSDDLDRLKQKAKKLGVPYQTFVAELLHQYAA